MSLILSDEAFLAMIWACHGDSRACYRRFCGPCGRRFFAYRPEARYCRAACRQLAYRRRVRLRRATLAHV